MALRETNYWKIGLFVVVGILIAVGAVFWLAAQRLNRELLPAVTYFDESVQGLDIGAPVKMRGVTIGTVATISFGPDQRLVEVHADIYADVMRRIGFPHTIEAWESVPAPDDLRIQLSSTGITGVKFLNVDFFDPETHPALDLPFSPPTRYVPSTKSTLKTFEQGLEDLLHRGPPLMKEIEKLAATTESRVAAFDAQDLAQRLSSLAETLQQKIDEVDLEALSQESTGLVRDLRSMLERAENDDGPMGELLARWTHVAAQLEAALEEAQLGEASRAVHEVVDELGAFTRAGRVALEELREDLAELRRSFAALRDLASYIERDPGALIRGRASAK